jgi:hypothetical protein
MEWCMMKRNCEEGERGSGKGEAGRVLALRDVQRLEVGVRAQGEKSVTTIHETMEGDVMAGIGTDTVTVTTMVEAPERIAVIGGGKADFQTAPRSFLHYCMACTQNL